MARRAGHSAYETGKRKKPTRILTVAALTNLAGKTAKGKTKKKTKASSQDAELFRGEENRKS